MEINFINHEEEEESQPVSPTGQYFTSSVISVSVIGVLESEAPIEIDDWQAEALLKDVFLPINPRFSSIMVIDKRGVKQWKKVEANIKDHMYKPIFPEGKSAEFYDDCFNQYLSKLAMDQLPKSRPLWEIHIIKYPTKNSAGNVVFKLHHALGDGFSLMGALLSCLQRAENPQLPLTFPALMNQNMNTNDDHKGIFKKVTGIFNTVSDFGWSLLKSSVIEDDKSPIRSGDVGVEFRPITITTMTFSLDQIKKMKEILQVATCGITKNPKDPIVNIDAADVDNELAAVEYVEDIYKFYKLAEDDARVRDYMDSQPEINSKMREILVDWLVEVHEKFKMMPESLYLTVNVVDRFLSMRNISRRELQLVGISSMLIACKYEEIRAPKVSDFIAISDNAYIREQVLLMEKAILGKLEWYLTVPTAYVFLVRYAKASVPADQEMESMAFFFAELGLMNYSTIIRYCPSKLAAAAVYAARCTLHKTPLWNKTLNLHTGYSEDQLMECAKFLVQFHSGAAENKLKAVLQKYSNPDRAAVALFPPARNLIPA